MPYQQADLVLSACARKAGFSASQVGHAFKRHFGGAPMPGVREQGLALTCRCLRERREAPVAEIARCRGYGGASQFSRSLRQAMGASPGAWRRGRKG